MKGTSLISGSVLEFKLPSGFGYGYCKILDFRYIREFDGVLGKVYDHIAKEPIKEISVLSGKDWLFGARRMPWLPNTRGRGAWKLRGVLISEDDNIIPDFKNPSKLSLPGEDESKIENWFVVKNIRDMDIVYYSYDQVKHLEDTVLSPQLGIEIRTVMEYCRQNKIEVEKYFDLEDLSILYTYRAMISVPVYSTIPKEIRGKAIVSK